MSVHNFEALEFQNNSSKCQSKCLAGKFGICQIITLSRVSKAQHFFGGKENQMSGWYFFRFQHVFQYQLLIIVTSGWYSPHSQ